MFNLFEIANFLARPVNLYEFTWGPTIWRYTSADRDITFEGNVYTAIPISDSGFTQGSDGQPFTVNLPRTTPLVTLFRSTPPSSSIELRARRYHKNDPDQEAKTQWVGTIGNVKTISAAESQIIGLSLAATIQRLGLRLCWERPCPYAVYDQDCKVVKADFKAETTITAMTGNTITVGSFGAWTGPQFAGGYVEWEASAEGMTDTRTIESHLGGTTLAVFGTTDRMTVGMDITLYLGCDQTTETCAGTFANLANHGGCKFMTAKSPFDGNPVF